MALVERCLCVFDVPLGVGRLSVVQLGCLKPMHKSAIVNRQFFSVYTAGLVDGLQRANVQRYVAPVVEGNAENLNE